MYSCTIELPKLYIQSTTKTQINLVLYWADWVVRAVLKISAILLKYPSFERGVFKFSWANKVSFCVPENKPSIHSTWDI